jgi:hypothetical protein
VPQEEASPPSRDIKTSDDYATRLLKLLPAEITGAYLAIRLVLQPETNDSNQYIAAFAAAIFVISPFFMYFVLKMRQIPQIIFLVFTYVVWISNFEINRITTARGQIIEWGATHGLSGSTISWIIAPEFIKGVAIIWLLLLSPFIFAKETMVARDPTPPDQHNPPE